MSAVKPFPAIQNHVLLPWASEIAEVDGELRPKLDHSAVSQITSAIPQEWLQGTDGPTIGGYSEYLETRLASSRFVEDAVRAYAQLF